MLLASSPTVEGIEKLVCRFYAGTVYRVDPESLKIERVSDGYVPKGVRIELKKGRYRLVSA